MAKGIFERIADIGSGKFVGIQFQGVADADGLIADSVLVPLSGYIISADVVLDGPSAWTPVVKNRDGSTLPIAAASLSATAYNIRPDVNSVTGNPENFILATGGFSVSGSGTVSEDNVVTIVVNMELPQ